MKAEEFKSLYDSVKPALLKLDSLVYPNSIKEIIDMYELDEARNMQALAKAYSDYELQEEELRKNLAETQQTLKEFAEKQSSLDDSIKQTLEQVRYISIEAEAKWPIFHINDENLDKSFVEQYEKAELNMRNNALFHTVDSYCNKLFWDKRVKAWKKATPVKSERIPLLEEALSLYDLEYYYGATSILVCQIYGIASDISSYIRKHGYVLTERQKQSLSSHYEIAYEDIDKEKGQLLQSFNFVLSGAFIWGKMFRYLKEEILCSSDSKKRWESQPLRNKICHGDQLNYGTKEHALKALLVVDMLIHYSRAVEKKIQEEEQEKDNGITNQEMV